jgi:hypothetical protein
LSFAAVGLKPVPVIVTLVLYGPVFVLSEAIVGALFCGVGFEPLFEQDVKKEIIQMNTIMFDKAGFIIYLGDSYIIN